MFAAPAFAGGISVDVPVLRSAAEGAPVVAGYMVLRNTGSQSETLVGVSGALSDRIELHEMTMDANGMTMRPLADGLVLHAGEAVALRPGGTHVMIYAPQGPVTAGDTHMLTLNFADSEPLEVEFDVLGIGEIKALDFEARVAE